MDEEKLREVPKFLEAINCNYNEFMTTINNKDNLYNTFKLKHKTKNRVINAPTGELKNIQKKLNVFLTELYLKAKKRSYIHGFLPEKSIVTNAQIHTGFKYVLNFDLKDFFASITSARINGALIKGFNFSEEIASMLSDITTLKDKLPEGAPTSPIISNIILNNFDSEFGYLAIQNGCKYTRYADDITISSNYKDAISIFYDFETKKLTPKIYKLVARNGFKINENKTRLADKSFEQQQVTGLVVNEKVNLKRKDLKNFRACLHELSKMDENDKQKSYNKASGYLAHIKNVRGSNDLVYGKYAAIFNAVYPEHPVDIDIFSPENLPKSNDLNFLKEWFSKRIVLISLPRKCVESSEVFYDCNFGTGYFIEYKNKYYLVTCEHVFYNDLVQSDSEKENENSHYFFKSDNEHPPLKITQESYYKAYQKDFHLTFNELNTPDNIIHYPNKDIVIIPWEVVPSHFFKLKNLENQIHSKVYVAGYSNYDSNSRKTLFDQLKVVSMSTMDKAYKRKHSYVLIDYLSTDCNLVSKTGEVLVQKVDGKFEHGDSGGPVVNTNGELVGMVYTGGQLNDHEFISSSELIDILE